MPTGVSPRKKEVGKTVCYSLWGEEQLIWRAPSDRFRADLGSVYGCSASLRLASRADGDLIEREPEGYALHFPPYNNSKSALSHEESAWLDNQAGYALISYQQYAFDLK